MEGKGNMERLTKRHKYNGKDYVSVDSRKYGMSCSNFCTNCGKADCDDIRKALFKLAEYEDLGLEPSEIKPYIEFEKMNVCDLVRENKRLSDKIMFLEAQLRTSNVENDGD